MFCSTMCLRVVQVSLPDLACRSLPNMLLQAANASLSAMDEALI